MVAAAATPAWLPYRQGPGLLGLNIEGAATITTFNTLSRGIAILIVYFKDAGCIMAATGTGFTLRSSYTSTAGSTLTLARQSDGTWLEISRSTPMEGSTAWTAFTPTCFQGASNPTLTVDYARYCVLGKVAFVEFSVQFTSAGSAGNTIDMSGWPSAINIKNPGSLGRKMVGTGWYLDAGTAEYPGIVHGASGSALRLVALSTSGQVGNNPNLAVANTDTLSMSACWEIA